MASTRILISATPTTSDLSEVPVTIIGQAKNLSKLNFDNVHCKLKPRVDTSLFSAALDIITSNANVTTVPLYLNLARLIQLPSKCSRHNTPTQCHALLKAVTDNSCGSNEAFIIVCEKTDVFASVCVVARAFPIYNRKTGSSTDGERTSKSERSIQLEFVLTDGLNLSAEDVTALDVVAESVRLSAKIVDTPAEEMNVCAFINEIEKVGQALNITPIVIRGDQLVKKGLGGIWSVGKAAASLPALAVLSHLPSGATETIAWVGKGIVYDTGGLSLKPSSSMVGMKKDCGGAAGILGAFSMAVKCGFQQNLHAVFCLAENAIGPLATRPDDIVTMYSGKTVEVNNTDAEGRMVLADGVAFASKDLGAKTIVDMATLTSAQGIATGRYHGAFITNSSKWEDACMAAGKLSGDLIFPLPYSPELHFKEFASSLADMKNSVSDRYNAQSSCAGLFIQSHIGFDYEGDWIHIDMSKPAVNGDRATGYGVALLTSMFAHHSSNAYVKTLSPLNTNNGDRKKCNYN